MGLLSKKKEPDLSLALLRKLPRRGVAIFSRRNPLTYQETILGRAGAFSIREEELILSCQNRILLRCPLKEIKAYELMNLSGVCLCIGDARYIAYYTNGSLGQKK